MRALAVTPGSSYGLSWQEVPDPVAAPGEVLIEVHNSSLNFGDLSNAPGGTPGTVPGWDAAGVVLAAAENGSGPKVGDRVVSFSYANGAWAVRRAVATTDVAVVPDKVDLAVAAALPVAGVTALRALRASGALIGRRVLITGASGGVGRYAVQLAALGGAHVIAAANRGAGLAELGAHEVVSTLDGVGPVDVVLDNVGGRQLVQAWGLVRPGGVVQSIGWTSGEPAEFPPYATVGPRKDLRSFQAGTDFGPDLAALLELVEAGRLKVDIGWRGSWSRFEEAAKALLGRQVTGKAVLDHD